MGLHVNATKDALSHGHVFYMTFLLEIKDLFEEFDKDNNGSLSEEEVRTGLFNLGRNPTKKEVKEILDELGIKKGKLTKKFRCSWQIS